jgi:hypothetical protein
MTDTDHRRNLPEGRGDDLAAPSPCPRCGNAGRLFTPNARRDPFSATPRYEPAWQCTACGHLEFVDASQTPGAVSR